MEKIIQKYIPLTEATYYILLCTTTPAHGYKIMQEVEDMTGGKVKKIKYSIYDINSYHGDFGYD